MISKLCIVLAWKAGMSSSANVPRAALGRSSFLISLRYSPQPPKPVRGCDFLGPMNTDTARKTMSMRYLAQRHQGGAFAIGDAGDSRGAKYRVGVIQTQSDQLGTEQSLTFHYRYFGLSHNISVEHLGQP